MIIIKTITNNNLNKNKIQVIISTDFSIIKIMKKNKNRTSNKIIRKQKSLKEK